MTKHVLIVTTIRWVSAAQLALAFAELGWTVDAVCPSSHPMGLTSALRRRYPFQAFRPEASLRRALLAADPTLVIPMDDLAAAYLRRLHEAAAGKANGDGARDKEQQRLRELFERSLGAPESAPVLESRTRFALAARAAGVPVPRAALPCDQQDLLATADEWNYPVVLKADGTSGGEGVRVAETPTEAATAFAKLQRPLTTSGVLLRLALDGNRNVVAPWLRRRGRTVSIQSFVDGHDANIAVACRDGEVLASIAVEALHTRRKFGPSAVVRVIENRAMLEAATKVVRQLGLSGLCGFDFVIEKGTGQPVLIEVNARATPICHLALGADHDLVAALCSALGPAPVAPRAKVTESSIVGLFPLSWQIDPASKFLEGAYRDLPKNEPTLVRVSLAKPRLPTRAQWKEFWSTLSIHLLMQSPAASPEQEQ